MRRTPKDIPSRSGGQPGPIDRFENTKLTREECEDGVIQRVTLYDTVIFMLVREDDNPAPIVSLRTRKVPSATTIRRINECFEAFEIDGAKVHRNGRNAFFQSGPHERGRPFIRQQSGEQTYSFFPETT